MAPEAIRACLWRHSSAAYLAIYSFIALAAATWMFGPGLLSWWFNRTDSLLWRLITSIILLAGFAVFVALYILFWVNRATQARASNGALLALLRGKRRSDGISRSGEGVE
jgi:hypothetical protein